VDAEGYLAQMEQLLAEARPVPLSASVMVNRKDFEDVIDDIRASLPEELRQSRWVIKERDEVLEQAEREAEQTLADAKTEATRLTSETEVVRQSQRHAERILEEAREQSRVLRLEAEDYVDSKLANFEIVLAKTMRSVEKGRERLRGRLVSDELAPDPVEQEPRTGGAVAASQLYDYESPEQRQG
jgi:cell division septum initiation protein DivIVA